MQRIRIRKVGGQWTSVRPGYGFGRPTTTTHPNWRTAIRATQPRPVAASADLERKAQFDYDIEQACS